MHDYVNLPNDLRRRSIALRRRFLAMYQRANHGHVGSSLSCADLLALVRFGWMRPGDELVLSKGHAAAALYAMLAEAGEIPEESLETFAKDGTLLSAHPPPRKLPGIPFATGSLGHGLSLAAGLAFGERLAGRDGRVYCLSSDGEIDEGSTWEAALFAAHHRLSNLVWLVDRNYLQGFGTTEETLRLEPLAAKLVAFGFRVEETDGHDADELIAARARVDAGRDERPTVVLCRTRKGRGLATEGTVDCHYLPMTKPQYEAAVAGLDAEEEALR